MKILAQLSNRGPLGEFGTEALPAALMVGPAIPSQWALQSTLLFPCSSHSGPCNSLSCFSWSSHNGPRNPRYRSLCSSHRGSRNPLSCFSCSSNSGPRNPVLMENKTIKKVVSQEAHYQQNSPKVLYTSEQPDNMYFMGR